MRIAVVLMCFGLVVLASSCAPSQVGMSYSSYGGNSAYYVDVSEYYHVPERDVIFIRDRRIPDDEIPVVFFIARRANVSPSTICDMRLSGQSWMDISLRFGLTPDVYYVPVAQVYGGPYEQVYTYYNDRPRTEWNSIRLSDDDIVNVVNLRFVSEQQSTEAPQVMKMRAEGKSFMRINEEARARKHGNQGRGNKRGRD
ncbi:MAG TPA: hypothetical protein VL633_05690 [Bacteroidota bacterium]|nr:hypothetical protein [Bacteroidota bacterium]